MKLLMENWRAHLKEHRGTPCSEAPAVERMECEKRTKELEKERAHRRKKKDELHPGKSEMDSLGRGIVEKKRKPQCTPGNKNHDTDGKFSSIASSTSWSDNNPSGKSDCVSGQYRKKGTTKKTWTKIRCGRKKDNTGKAKFKCKDGSKAYQEGLDQEEWVKVRRADLEMLLELVEDEETKNNLLVEPLDEELEEVKSNLNQDQVKQFCNTNGYNSLEQWLRRMNAIELSQKGELTKKD